MPYGKKNLKVSLSDSFCISIIKPSFVPAIPKPRTAIRKALKTPINSPALSELIQPDDRVGIVFSDITRPVPNWLILPEILAEIGYVPKQNILLFNALGTHRKNSQQELRYMLGDWIVDNYRIIQNDSSDQSTQMYLGKTCFGHDILINRELLNCDIKILTGFIEPHFFAGFSGGAKTLMPGMAGSNTIFGNHNAKMIAHPKATWLVTEGNPIFEEIREIGDKVENLFLLNVTQNINKGITGVFSGEVREAHARGCNFVKEIAMVPVQSPFDIVITTNSGYPLDINLYQSVKGMSAAAKVVKRGGAIVMAAACQDGIPDHGLYGNLLRSNATPGDLLESIMSSPEVKQDQWQAQIQALIQQKADVYLFSDGLSEDQISSALLKPVKNLEACVEFLVNKLGPDAKIGILIEGPQTVPYIIDEA
ncbi:MAG TPA: nickel-dependent lactate racemase [Anaerolineae bacterium]|nr:nickel-dependent lactate racemase [Anaerolineae bacterium]